MKKSLILTLLMALLVIPCAFADPTANIAVTVTITQSVSVTVTPGAYPFEPTTEGQTLTTAVDAFTAVNNGNGLQNLTIAVADSADWVAASTVGKDQFVMNYNADGSWKLITPATGASLAAGLAKGAEQKFGLQLMVPDETDHGGVPQSISVTVTASAS